MSEVTDLDENRTVVFSVAQYNEATRDSLQNVRDQIAAVLTSSQSENLMASRAQNMLDAINAGDDFVTAATAVGAEAASPSIFTRVSEGADQSMAVSIFTAIKPTEGKPTLSSTRNDAGSYVVFSVDSVIPGRPESIPQTDRDTGKEQIINQYGVGDFVAFVQALRANAEVIINQDALAAQDLFQ
jgi:peptidyl-prolyl cis-trans isomerase D